MGYTVYCGVVISSAINTNAAGHGTSLISYVSASRLQIPLMDDILLCYASFISYDIRMHSPVQFLSLCPMVVYFVD